MIIICNQIEQKNKSVLKSQHGNKLLDTWQQLYDSNFGKGLRDFMYGQDHDLSDEKYIQKHGYAKPVGGTGVLGVLVAPEWAGLEFPEVTVMHYGVKSVPKGVSAVETGRFVNVPQKTAKIKSVAKSNGDKFLQKPLDEQDRIVKFWNDERYSNFNQLQNSKDLFKFKNGLNKQ